MHSKSGTVPAASLTQSHARSKQRDGGQEEGTAREIAALGIRQDAHDQRPAEAAQSAQRLDQRKAQGRGLRVQEGRWPGVEGAMDRPDAGGPGREGGHGASRAQQEGCQRE